MNKLSNKLFWYGFKTLPHINLCISLLCILLVQLVFSLKFLRFKSMAEIGELVISLAGIIVLPSLAFIEDARDIKETIYCKKMSNVYMNVIRVIFITIFLIAYVGMFCMLAWIQGSRFDIFEIIWGVFITAFTMGALGFFTGVLTENMSMAYLIAFAYYSFEFATKGRYTKVFYLFSLRKGYFSDFKLIILIFAIFLVITSIFILHKRQSFLR